MSLDRGGSTDPSQTPSTLWVGVSRLSKHLVPTWVTVVVSPHTRIKHLVPMWVNAVVLPQKNEKRLLPLWVSVVVPFQSYEKHLLPLWVTVCLLFYIHLTVAFEENM